MKKDKNIVTNGSKALRFCILLQSMYLNSPNYRKIVGGIRCSSFDCTELELTIKPGFLHQQIISIFCITGRQYRTFQSGFRRLWRQGQSEERFKIRAWNRCPNETQQQYWGGGAEYLFTWVRGENGFSDLNRYSRWVEETGDTTNTFHKRHDYNTDIGIHSLLLAHKYILSENSALFNVKVWDTRNHLVKNVEWNLRSGGSPRLCPFLSVFSHYNAWFF